MHVCIEIGDGVQGVVPRASNPRSSAVPSDAQSSSTSDFLVSPLSPSPVILRLCLDFPAPLVPSYQSKKIKVYGMNFDVLMAHDSVQCTAQDAKVRAVHQSAGQRALVSYLPTLDSLDPLTRYSLAREDSRASLM